MLTRTVADTAAILDVLAGYEPGDATWAPPPSEPFAAAAGARPSRRRGSAVEALRIAATTLAPLADAAVDPLCARAVDEAAELLRSLGHEVEEVDPPWQVEGLARAVRSGLLHPHRAVDRLLGDGRRARADGEDMEPMSWAIYSMVRS